MRDDSFPDSARAADGFSDPDLVLNLRPYDPGPRLEDVGLRLDREPRYRPRKRRPISRGALLLGGWAAVLVAAVGIAYIAQPDHNLGQPEAPPAVAPPPGEELGQPITAPSIASDPAHFTQATSAPEINPPEPPDAAEGPGQVQIAEATPPPTTADAAVDPQPAPPKAEPAKSDAGPESVKPATSASTKAEPKAPKVEKVADKPKAADPRDLPQLKVRMTRAYAEAVKAGTPKSVLKARQAEWAVLRAKAEKKGPSAVAALYRTRAAELEAIAKKSAVRGRGAT